MSLDSHECKLQLDWLVEASNHEVVFLVVSALVGGLSENVANSIKTKQMYNLWY